MFGEQQRADRLLHEKQDIKIDNSHHHHSVFNYKGLTVENHYDFLNIYAHLSSRIIEKRLKELAENAVPLKMKDGTEVWLPSADFNALFILRHTAAHFAGSAMIIRQIIDWGMFVQKHHDEVNGKGCIIAAGSLVNKDCEDNVCMLVFPQNLLEL